MRVRGLYASIEAMLSLLFLATLLLVVQPAKEPSLEDLYILQKENDLLKLWAKEGIPMEREMVADFEIVFPGKSGEIKVNGDSIAIGSRGKAAISSEILFFGSQLNKTRIALTVFE